MPLSLPILQAENLVPALYPKQLKIISAPLNDKALRVITLRDANPDLITHFNQGLTKAHASGTYLKLRKHFQLF